MKFFKPTNQQDMVYKEAHDLTSYLTGMYSLEEQTEILNNMRDHLIVHRQQEILQTEHYLQRLKETLNEIKPVR